ncbi:MAG: iron-sulfur cluster loop [Planctomycetota bacterium]
MNQANIVRTLIKRGNELFNKPFEAGDFTGNKDANDLLNDLARFPHAYVLACLMDRKVKAERAWIIPYRISQELGGFEFQRLLKADSDNITNIFKNKGLHIYNDMMAEIFMSGVKLINDKYEGNASKIWSGNPSSATVVRRFLEFDGAGVKIATMATNILARDFKIPLRDRMFIDISPDVQVKKVFTRIGFIPKDASNDDLIYCARELYPEYPGIFDLSAWEIGRKWCSNKKPTCNECYLDADCPKII